MAGKSFFRPASVAGNAISPSWRLMIDTVLDPKTHLQTLYVAKQNESVMFKVSDLIATLSL